MSRVYNNVKATREQNSTMSLQLYYSQGLDNEQAFANLKGQETAFVVDGVIYNGSQVAQSIYTLMRVNTGVIAGSLVAGPNGLSLASKLQQALEAIPEEGNNNEQFKQ